MEKSAEYIIKEMNNYNFKLNSLQNIMKLVRAILIRK